MNEKIISKKELLLKYGSYDIENVDDTLNQALKHFNRKVVVLDDDPTGVQTVHDIYVYTDWSVQSIRSGFDDESSMFFILTNSRGFTAEHTALVHQEIARNIAAVSKETGKDFVIISRSDSTLRGHYPLETEVLRDTVKNTLGITYDGEVIIPFFVEGGRFTAGNVHYVADGDDLVPAAMTDFAKDRTFGYKSSDLTEWVEEKTKGRYAKENVVQITLEELRSLDYAGITKKLLGVNDFNKVVVNALAYEDVKVFVTALIQAIQRGKNFMFRSAAALTKVIGGVSDREVLTREELVNTKNRNGGLIVVGSHVSKTTKQMAELMKLDDIVFIEFNQHLVLDDAAFEAEMDRVIRETDDNIRSGKTVAVYTKRERFDLNNGNKEDELRIAVKISDAVSSIVASLTVRPNFIIAKGGITSSDVGTKGLRVKKALVMGQILKGIPVWLTGPESKFPDMPFVIFPGNVGDDAALSQAVQKIRPEKGDRK